MPFLTVLQGFIDKRFPEPFLQTFARLLFLLSGDAAVVTVVPFDSHSLIDDISNSLLREEDDNCKKWIDQLTKYSTEIAELFSLARQFGHVKVICDFALYLVRYVVKTHQDDCEPQPADPIPGTYNPESGVAYYFTEHGNQLRKLPKYDIKTKKKKGKGMNVDDLPIVEDCCNKLYPRVSYRGHGYIYMWFCPIHGHSYGLHLIDGAEGRKDGFCSLWKYITSPPKEVFYDFACSLSEYMLNREPKFFCCTRVWHDLFHGVAHVCGANFKSGRVVGLEGANTEICEQVNGYLQCIKYTASHLTQKHFMFFLQYMLYLWNKDKTKKFSKQVAIAYQGAL